MKRCRPMILTPVLAALLPLMLNAQSTGSIRGTVVDEKGAPVSNAKVNASPVGGWLITKLVRYVETDAQGRFLIDGLTLGKYGIFAMKEEAQYPNLSSSFYSDNVFPTAVINAAAPTAEVRVQLGPKAAVLTGSITDAINGSPVDAAFQLTRVVSPSEWLGCSAPPNYRILLPSSVDVLVEVSAPGYRTWSSPAPLRLQPGAEMRLDIQLEPSHDPSLHPSKFLVLDGYVGWLLLEYNVKEGAPVPTENGIEVFKFPQSGALTTSSPGPQRGADDQYLYYATDGSTHEIPMDYRNGGGRVWGQYEGTRNGILSQFGFFVGTEEQYKKYQSRRTRPGYIHSP